MSTHCRIGILLSDDQVASSHCHLDGYPNGLHGMHMRLNGLVQGFDKARRLATSGDMRSLQYSTKDHFSVEPETLKDADAHGAINQTLSDYEDAYRHGPDHHLYLYVSNQWWHFNGEWTVLTEKTS